MRAEELVLELAETAGRRLRPAQAESLHALALLMREGDPADVMAAGDLWWRELGAVVPLTRMLGESWQSEDALHAGLCLRACLAVRLWFEEMTAAVEEATQPGEQ